MNAFARPYTCIQKFKTKIDFILFTFLKTQSWISAADPVLMTNRPHKISLSPLFSLLQTRSWMFCTDCMRLLGRSCRRLLSCRPIFSKLDHECLAMTDYRYWIDHSEKRTPALFLLWNSNMNTFIGRTASIRSTIAKINLFLLLFLKNQLWMSTSDRLHVLNRSKQKSISFPSLFSKLTHEYLLATKYLYQVDDTINHVLPF